MEKAYFTEVELALRWDLSPKTLQRWRTDGRGPHFLKFSKCVRYPIDEIMVFENNGTHLRVVKAVPEGYHQLSRPKIEGMGCTSPALSNGKLVVRQREKVVCFDLRPEK
mgnify:CR=1 FL=1